MIVWTLALAELAAIAANTSTARQLLVSQRILRVLFSGQNTGRLRLVPRAAYGAMFTLLGGAIRAACYRGMGRYFIPDVAIQNHHRLITDGPYNIVRHPGYTGGVMVMGGLYAFFTAPGSFLRESRVLDTNLGRFCAGLSITGIVFPLLLVRHRVQLIGMSGQEKFRIGLFLEYISVESTGYNSRSCRALALDANPMCQSAVPLLCD